jgi:DNA polymerase I-like protein with 3'-5' exonuclease and polymerase domains
MMGPPEDTQVIAIDTETFYSKDYSVSKLGAHAYTRHPLFETLLISAAWGEGKGQSIVATPAGFPWGILEGKKIVAHNAGFDRAVLKATPEAPEIPGDVWIDSAGMAAYHQFPRSLKGAANELWGETISKDVRDRMEGKRLEDLSQGERDDFLRYARLDAVACFKVYEALKDTTPQHEIELMSLAMDQGEYGVQIDGAALRDGIKTLTEAKESLMRQLPWFPELKANSRKGFAAWCKAGGLPAPESTKDDDPELRAWKVKHSKGAAMIGILHRYRSANKTLKLLHTIRERITPEGILQFEIKYYGSEITGRFAGGGGLNMLNLPKNAVEGVSVRPMIKARASHKLAIVDLSNIEARVGAWLVGDEAMLQSIRDGVDIYEAHARATMGYTDPRPLKEVDNDMRQLAKTRVLGLGFQQGAERLSDGMDISIREAKKIVSDFRCTNPKITDKWRDLGVGLEHNHDGEGNLVQTLPSGRRLQYFNVKNELTEELRFQWKAGTTQGTEAKRPAWYGGKLYQNQCQSVARDIFCHGMLAVVQGGYRVLFSVHDELVIEVPEACAEGDLENIKQLMTTGPSWSKRLPLDAEGTVEDVYKK